MILATLDTNVVASGLLGLTREASTPGEILRRWRRGQFAIATSEPLIDELIRTLAGPYFRDRVSPVDAAESVTLLWQSAVSVTREVHGVATHPEDDIVIATALSAHADVIVTGDLKLLNRVRRFEGVQLLSPRDFLGLLGET